MPAEDKHPAARRLGWFAELSIPEPSVVRNSHKRFFRLGPTSAQLLQTSFVQELRVFSE